MVFLLLFSLKIIIIILVISIHNKELGMQTEFYNIIASISTHEVTIAVKCLGNLAFF